MTSAGAALDFLTTRTRLGLGVSVVVITCDVVVTVGDSLIVEKMQNLLLTD
jgi:hypothetical protein